jgi:hypothetical protein|tara:strand:- start:200 stop:625 length:426 start_codon:yes stop_codon:yes gene_type:complete
MSKKTPSQGFNYKFEIVFDKKKETTLQKIKRWISKQKPPLNIILKYLFSYIEKMYWDGKVLQTMAGVDLETKKLHELWEADDKQITPHTVETGVFGKEGWSIQISNPIVGGRTEESESGMVSGSDASGLREDDGDKKTSNS